MEKNFIEVILNSNQMNKKSNFYTVKHGGIVLRNVYMKYHGIKIILLRFEILVIKQIMLLLPTFQLTY